MAVFNSFGKHPHDQKMGKSLKKVKVLSRVFSEDFERVTKKILDPEGQAVRRWNQVFLVSCLVALFVDPLFFLVPRVQEDQLCADDDISFQVGLTLIRSVCDVFYIIHILVQFRTAYVGPSTHVFGRGELVIDTSKIALRYLRKGFWIDFIAALPVTQLLVWAIIPSIRGSSTIAYTKMAYRSIILPQYILRHALVHPPSSQIVKVAGVETKAAWAGAVYNMMHFLFASHVVGVCWYLISIYRQVSCWISACNIDPSCQHEFFDCHSVDDDPTRDSWFQSNNVSTLCFPTNTFYNFATNGDAITYGVTSSKFPNKIFYCFWWGLRNLSTFGQNLFTSSYVPEVVFSLLVGIFGLVLFVLLFGTMQRFLQSTTVRLEEWRMKRTDTEEWMHHRQLPPELRQAVRKYEQYKWFTTQGVDEEDLLCDLHLDLRRDIKRHLCLDLVRGVPLFDQMDIQMLDAICDKLKPTLCTEGTFKIRQGDPVNEMLFIIRGLLESSTTNGGRTGFLYSCLIGPGDFCGDELLTWALDPRSSVILPSSTCTLKALSEVEAFSLKAEDLKLVALQFRRLNSKQLRHKFKSYSHQWRTWAACSIQAAWRRYKRRKDEAQLEATDNRLAGELDLPTPGSGWAVYYATRLAVRRAESFRRGVNQDFGPESSADPDFFFR